MRSLLLALPVCIAGVLTPGCATAFGQAPESLTFEVATVKPRDPPTATSISGGPGTADPTRMTWTALSLLRLLWIAYDLQQYQVTGPDWLKTERYDIVAKLPPGTTKEQANVMLQNLLRERLGVVAHYESKESPVEELTVAKGGPKLEETDLDPNAPLPDDNFQRGQDGLLQLIAPGMVTSFTAGSNAAGGVVAKAQAMAQLAKVLGNQLGHPVIDKTGLTGKYDFNVRGEPAAVTPCKFDPGRNCVDRAQLEPTARVGCNEVCAAGMAEAVQKQLGLKLTRVKGTVDVLVIDKANKIAAEN